MTKQTHDDPIFTLGARLMVLAATSLPLACSSGFAEQVEALDTTSEALVCGSAVLARVAAAASSLESSSFPASNAIDGDATTRWSSAFGDPQWLRVDLGAVRFIDRVVVSFQHASSKNYTIQVSNDASTWTTVYSLNNAPVGPITNDITGLNATGRYVRLNSTARTTAFGVSVFELSVFGDADGTCSPTYRIDSVLSGKTLDVKDRSTADGARIQQWTYVAGDNQKWIATPAGSGRYQIKSLLSGKCLDVKDGSTADGAALQQWACNGFAQQRFTLNQTSPGTFQIIASHSGKCLDVTKFGTTNGTLIQQWSCSGNTNQSWTLSQLGSDFTSDPNNCGSAGHSCLGGACVSGVCQAATVISDVSCANAMAADDQNIFVGDVDTIVRYGITGTGKTTLLTGVATSDMIRDGAQLFWQNGGSGVERLNDGQSSPTLLYTPGASQLGLTGSTLVGFDSSNARFVSFDRNLTAPGMFSTIVNVGSDTPQSSASTSSFLYYMTSSATGTAVKQVNRSNAGVTVVDDQSSIFGITAFGDTVYWNYGTTAGVQGIRRLASATGSAVQEAVTPATAAQAVSFVFVDASGIYHSFFDGTTSAFYVTPHDNSAVRTLVTRGSSPTQSNPIALLTNSIVWLTPCNRVNGGVVQRLAKP